MYFVCNCIYLYSKSEKIRGPIEEESWKMVSIPSQVYTLYGGRVCLFVPEFYKMSMYYTLYFYVLYFVFLCI